MFRVGLIALMALGAGFAECRAANRLVARTLELHPAIGALVIGQVWHVDVQPDGSVAFATMPVVNPSGIVGMPAEFTADQYSKENLASLRGSLRAPLIAAGLFADEADALLNTWARSYFQDPGERMFFLVPARWTDAVLPLNLSVPADVTRVMVGRIELVTPAQRALLHAMAQASMSNLRNLKQVTAAMTRLRNDPAKAPEYNALAGGHGRLEDLGVPVPQVYADFLALGRFRTALILDAKDDSGTLMELGGALAP